MKVEVPKAGVTLLNESGTDIGDSKAGLSGKQQIFKLLTNDTGKAVVNTLARRDVTFNYNAPSEGKAGWILLNEKEEPDKDVYVFGYSVCRLLGDKVKLSGQTSGDGDFYSWEDYKAHLHDDWEYVGDRDNALDGYFYYKKKLAPGDSTPALISRVKTEYGSIEDISDFDIIVYSETVQTTEIDDSGTVYTDNRWEDAWESFLKIPAS